MPSHEPSPNQLEQLREFITVTLVAFERELVRLYPDDFLPRYNRITADFQNRSDTPISMLFITVHRGGSKIGGDNFYTVPLHVPELAAGRTCRYEFLSFDSFNERFESIRINLTTPQEYEKRRLAQKYLEKASDLTKYVPSVDAS